VTENESGRAKKDRPLWLLQLSVLEALLQPDVPELAIDRGKRFVATLLPGEDTTRGRPGSTSLSPSTVEFDATFREVLLVAN
jgi:hypothetical protein